MVDFRTKNEKQTEFLLFYHRKSLLSTSVKENGGQVNDE